MKLERPELLDLGASTELADKVLSIVSRAGGSSSPTDVWTSLRKEVFSKLPTPHAVSRFLFDRLFENWDHEKLGPVPVWTPDSTTLYRTHLYILMQELKLRSYDQLYEWSISHRDEFWGKMISLLGIRFQTPLKSIRDKKSPLHAPTWFPDMKMNIAENCFLADSRSTAILFARENGKIESWTYGMLHANSCRVANGLVAMGVKPGDAVAIDMTMTAESVAIYLGIVLAGCAAVSIADSFAADEIKTRLRISNAKVVFTQDMILRGGKELPMYDKVIEAGAERVIVLPADGALRVQVRPQDISWERFLSPRTEFRPVACAPDATTNILFSSGTTGDPKAIPWTHVTPLKCAVDGYLHGDIHPGERVAWPTNLGWMMGPWLIYAGLVNKATLALYYGAPLGRDFGKFVQDTKVQMLGLVPSIVKHWRSTDCMKDLDWKSIRLFASTGECSNADDYFFLMSLANFAPVIEYCGGTEIGGGYVTGTLVQPASPGTFTTPSMGLSFQILDEAGKPSPSGEVFLEPPSIGLSNTLLNKDHFEVYYKDTPPHPKGLLYRRHGDQMEKLPNGFYRALGRADDTMNLGGIKVSSAEIERVVGELPEIRDNAAIAVNPAGGGPSILVVYAVLKDNQEVDAAQLKKKINLALKHKFNPLFKAEDVELVPSLPRTASNKVMRRVIRKMYSEQR